MKKIFLACFLLLSALFAGDITEGKEYRLLDKNEQLKGADDKIVVLFSVFCNHCQQHFKKGSWDTVAGLNKGLKLEQWQVVKATKQNPLDYDLWAFARMLDETNGVSMFSKRSAQFNLANDYFKALFEDKLNFDVSSFYEFGLNSLKKSSKMMALSYEDLIENGKKPESVKFKEQLESGLKIAMNTGTPAVIVRGKWLIDFRNIKNETHMFDVIKEVVKRK